MVNADSMQLYRGMDIGTAQARRSTSGAASRTTCWTSSTSPRPPASPRTSASPGRRSSDCSPRGRVPAPRRRLRPLRPRGPRRPRLPGHRPAIRGAPGGRAGRARRRRRCTRGCAERDPAAADRDPADQRPPDRPRAGGHRADRPAVLARRCPRPDPRATTPSRSASTSSADELDERIDAPGRPDVGRRAWSTRCARWSGAACATGRRPAARSGYQQVLDGSSTAATRTRRAATRPSRATRRFVRRQRSWFRRDPRITLARRDAAPDLLDARAAQLA